MEWVLKLEAKSGWGDVETIEVGRLERRVVGLTAEEVGLTLSEGKGLLGELARLVLQTQMEEFATCARVCRDCLKLRRRRDNRTRKIQTLFGTITVDAPRISVCPCQNDWGGCLPFPTGGRSAGPVHARASAATGRTQRQALLPRGGSPSDYLSSLPSGEPRDYAQPNASRRG